MSARDVRKKFVDYFVKNGHRYVKSSAVVPENDPTLLFTNAGMNQFKNVFLGLDKRDYARAVTSQKCVRAGGKHNDLDNVGFTARHHTFFEMLGNFSFGDYFKKDAIHFAWELVTKEYGLDKKKLYVSVFENDDEAADIWHKQEGVAKDRIYRFGEASNFWRMGDSGPCGPCSEIFYDQGPDVEGDAKDNVMGGDGDRFIEIWNLVFMQYEEDGKGGRKTLPKPSVDTGMGLERITAVVQGELSNYHTTEMQALIERAARISKKEYVKDLRKLSAKSKSEQAATNVAFRVLADHARAAAFMMADGVLPSNEGRGYVLRRIMRRAIRYGRNLTSQSVYPEVINGVIEIMGSDYTELNEAKKAIISRAREEEERFLKTLDQGTELLRADIEKLNSSGKKILPGEVAFKLYDTFGFPLDLTKLMAKEHGIALDEMGFDQWMEKAREKARSSWKAKSVPGDLQHLIQLSKTVAKASGATSFLGYNQTTTATGRVVKITDGKSEVKKIADHGIVILDQTCFYAEGGGQVGDTGRFIGAHGAAEVLDCTKLDEVFLHHVKVTEGEISLGENLELQVDRAKRLRTASNHSATHLLHAALRKVLGESVTQAGQMVDAEKLRFDFTHKQPLSRDEISRIENIVNSEISRGELAKTEVLAIDEAKKSGAIALFGEKYGDKVRVLSLGSTSKELCGGTHVTTTSEIRLFKIVSESGVSSGVRRIEALSGDKALEFLNHMTEENLKLRETIGAQENWQSLLDAQKPSALLTWAEKQRELQKDLQKKIQAVSGGGIDLEKILAGSQELKGGVGKLVLGDLDLDDRQVLSDISDKLKDKIRSGVIVLVGRGDQSHPVVVTVSKDLVGQFNAGQILKELATILGGKGGGRPDFAQGAVPDRSKIQDAFKQVRRNQLP